MGSICGSDSSTPDDRAQNTSRNSTKIDKSASWIGNKDCKIVIIGAGPAGVHMSSLLSKSGYTNITILEKLDRIGGKSWTLKDEAGNPAEMGTCFTSPLANFFKVIYELFDEYFPSNKMVPLPDKWKGIFGSFNDETRAEFKDYIYAQIEDITTPKWLHFMPDILTGGINFIISANRYIEIHKEIFGEEDKNFSTLPKPKDKSLINMTMMAWLKANNLEGMIPLYLLVYSMFGYGSIKDVPAYYGLWFFKPSVVHAMVTLQGIVDPQPTSMITSEGFQKLWINIINKHNIDVKFNINVKSIDRGLDNGGSNGSNGSNGGIKIVYNDTSDEKGSGIDNTINCDVLFLACGNKNALKFLDASEQESEIFGAIEHYTLSTAFIDYKTNDLLRKEYTADNLYPKALWSQDGHTVEFRMTQKRLKTDNYPDDVYGKEGRDRAIVKQFIGSAPKEDTGELLTKLRYEDLGKNGLNITDIKEHEFKVWQYFPHYSIESINKNYPWIVRDEMQGKYNNTYYIGSSVCFESTKDVVEWNIQLKQRIGF